MAAAETSLLLCFPVTRRQPLEAPSDDYSAVSSHSTPLLSNELKLPRYYRLRIPVFGFFFHVNDKVNP